ncbi:histidine kinase [Brevibacillus sp. B_LB10_24]|uniref:sensor histidine kinase n=1 Tax=Brevibacillus sp. B_LB10_24 TaxID=3380645 RepID=UPI0038BDF7BB
MARQSRLGSIQWKFVKQFVWLSAGIVTAIFAVLFAVVHYLRTSTQLSQLVSDYLGVQLPESINWGLVSGLFLLALLTAAVVGIAGGYVIGNLLKKRLNTLRQATMNLERGLLSYRLPELGTDEIGEIGWQFNRIAEKWEDQVASLQRLSNHNAALGEQVRHAAVVEERQRLARELHDAVSQQLFAIAMTTAAIKRMMEQNPQRAMQQIELVEEMAAAAQAEMRALLLHLRPATLQDRPLREAVTDLLEELTQKHPINITWELEEIEDLPSGIEDHLFRILQEALSNTLRHSQADKIEVKLFTLREQVRLRVSDNGIGFDPDDEKLTSYGLHSMRERVNEIGGSLDIISSTGTGTQIEVRIPLVMEINQKGGDQL